MEKLIFDDGLLELEINDNGVLRFNASDFNVYQRFYALLGDLPELEKRYSSLEQDQSQGDEAALAARALDLAREIDLEVKRRLSGVFGPQNDFDALTGGMNLMAWGGNGERLITNLLTALQPYLEKGLERHRKDAAAAAVSEARKNRAARG